MFVKTSYESFFPLKAVRKHKTLRIFYEALTGLLIPVLGEQTSPTTAGISAFAGGKKGREKKGGSLRREGLMKWDERSCAAKQVLPDWPVAAARMWSISTPLTVNCQFVCAGFEL